MKKEWNEEGMGVETLETLKGFHSHSNTQVLPIPNALQRDMLPTWPRVRIGLREGGRARAAVVAGARAHPRPGKQDGRQIFQTTPPRGFVSLEMAGAAFDALHRLAREDDMVALCGRYGIDYDRLMLYYKLVVALERQYRMDAASSAVPTTLLPTTLRPKPIRQRRPRKKGGQRQQQPSAAPPLGDDGATKN
jgi:hypothetical protein